MKKINIAVIFGGKSSEHKVSLLSARNIIKAIDKTNFNLLLIGISTNGIWHVYPEEHFVDFADDPAKIKLAENGNKISFSFVNNGVELINTDTKEKINTPNIIFPIIHGTSGEDGNLQGFLNILNIPYIGPKTLSSAICMDKAIAKQLLAYNNINVIPFIILNKGEKISYADASSQLGNILFVKPANQGSSVGVSKVEDQQSFEQALALAFTFDTKVLIEQANNGREIECAVLGIDNPVASVCGEIITDHFYTYDNKYINSEQSKLVIPAQLEPSIENEIQTIAVKAFKTLNCVGLTRVDFFVEANGKVIVNELNTLPGFTDISMYPKLWMQSGLTYADLINKLILDELTINKNT